MQDAIGVERQQSGPIPSCSCRRKMASRQHLDDHHLQVGDREMGRDSGRLWKEIKAHSQPFLLIIDKLLHNFSKLRPYACICAFFFVPLRAETFHL